jgi:hypothetical protein
MAKKLFLERERAMSTAEVPSISREEFDSEIASSSGRNNQVLGTTLQLPFTILEETSKSFSKFNATGRTMLIKFRAPGEEQEPLSYLKEWITALYNYLVDKVPDRDLVGLRIRNSENVMIKWQILFCVGVTSSRLIWFGMYLGRSFRVMRNSLYATVLKYIWTSYKCQMVTAKWLRRRKGGH